MTLTPAETRFGQHQEKLERFLTEACVAKSARIIAAQPLTGGAIQENWRLEVAITDQAGERRRELVLRSDSTSGITVSHTRAQEFALLEAAAGAGVTVPQPLWLCEDPQVIGRPFYIMALVPGTAAGHRIVKDDGPGGDKGKLAERLGLELARIHGILPPRPDLAFLGVAPADPASDAVMRYRGFLDALGAPQPAIEWGLRWCELNPPPLPPEIVLLHQDFRSGNYLVDDSGLTAILDWEFAAWGDPMSDIGWFCAKCWRFGRPEREAGGIAERGPFYQGYERQAGRRIDPEAVAYWEVMAHIRWAIIALQQGERFNSGAESSLELALTGRLMPPELEVEILRATAPERWPAA